MRDELPGMWEDADLIGGWADSDDPHDSDGNRITPDWHPDREYELILKALDDEDALEGRRRDNRATARRIVEKIHREG